MGDYNLTFTRMCAEWGGKSIRSKEFFGSYSSMHADQEYRYNHNGAVQKSRATCALTDVLESPNKIC